MVNATSQHGSAAIAAPTRSDGKYAFGWCRALITASLFACIWWVIAGDDGSWVVGIPSILLAAALAGRGREVSSSIHPGRLPSFCLWFVAQSVRGGLDVARRALLPSLPIAPGIVRYRTTLADSARPWLATTITLLPGTLAMRLRGNAIDIHAIDRSATVEPEIRCAERWLARLVGHSLQDSVP